MANSIFTLRGIWVSPNKFVDINTGELLTVIPYKGFTDQYEGMYPINCYMQLEDKEVHLTIMNIVIDDNQEV